MSEEIYKSKEEEYFEWWLNDLKNAGIIKRYTYEYDQFTLSTAKFYRSTKHMVTKVKLVEHSLLDAHKYTPDFIVQWDRAYEGIYYRTISGDRYTNKPPFFAVVSKKDGEHYTFFEVKPDYDQNNMTRLFRLNQKWLYDKYQLYVELAILPTLFKRTFVPERYLRTDKNTTIRKINFDKRSLSDYTKWLKSQIK